MNCPSLSWWNKVSVDDGIEPSFFFFCRYVVSEFWTNLDVNEITVGFMI